MRRLDYTIRDGQLTEKDMEVLKEGDSALDQHRKTRGEVKDYSMKHRVEIFWDLNDEAKRERIFKLRIDDYEVLLDAEEVARTIRWV